MTKGNAKVDELCGDEYGFRGFYLCSFLFLPKRQYKFGGKTKMKVTSAKNYYLNEFSYDDGEYEITFNIIDIDFVNQTITVAITRAGKITQDTFQLLRDKDGKLYFEFGMFYENKINLDDFEEVL